MKEHYNIDQSTDLYAGVHNACEVNLFNAILKQAIIDAYDNRATEKRRMDALNFLLDEDNIVLQMCIQSCNMNYEKILKKVSKQMFNLDL
jgi:hypothetical protein